MLELFSSTKEDITLQSFLKLLFVLFHIRAENITCLFYMNLISSSTFGICWVGSVKEGYVKDCTALTRTPPTRMGWRFLGVKCFISYWTLYFITTYSSNFTKLPVATKLTSVALHQWPDGFYLWLCLRGRRKNDVAVNWKIKWIHGLHVSQTHLNI